MGLAARVGDPDDPARLDILGRYPGGDSSLGSADWVAADRSGSSTHRPPDSARRNPVQLARPQRSYRSGGWSLPGNSSGPGCDHSDAGTVGILFRDWYNQTGRHFSDESTA